jgi:MOSC domain-containing protein YiiM
LAREVDWFGRTVRTAIWKHPVAGPVAVAGHNLAGDDQADRRVHGGVDKAVYAYAVEDYAWWSEQRGETLVPGTFGENLTTTGFDLTEAWVGERWQVGTAVLEVSEPRQPCFKLGIRMGDASFVDAFDEACRPGTYLRIVTPGVVTAGDAVTLVARPDVRLTVGELARLDRDAEMSRWELVARHPAVSRGWRLHAQRALARWDVTDGGGT